MSANLARGRAEWLRNALGELTEMQRFIVECRHGLRDGHEHKLKEIARLMGRDRNTVREQYRSAIKRLNHAATHPLPFYSGEVYRPPANAEDDSSYDLMGCEPPVCLSPLVPSEHGLTHDETVQMLKELFGGS